MSCLLMRPPALVPGMVARSMPCSLAMRRTKGELWMRSPAERDCAARPGPDAAVGEDADAAGLAAGAGATIWGRAEGAGAEALAGSAALGVAAGAGACAGAAALAAPAPSPAASSTPPTVLIGTV